MNTADDTTGAAPAGQEVQRLTVLYDERCAFCRRCRDWLLTQPCFVEMDLVAAGSPMARDQFGSLPWLGQELLVADQTGRVWVGPAAFLVCLWATVRYRAWAYRLTGPTLAPMATRFFMHISKRRDRWSAWIREDPECSWCEQVQMEHGR